jgi:hypothetical protein
MQFERIIDSKAPKDGKPAEPAYMIFSPDDGQFFQLIGSGKRRTPSIEVIRGSEARIPINGEDVTPLREAKSTRNDDDLLGIIRKYVQTQGIGLRPPATDSLSGTVHTVPEGAELLTGRARYNVDGQFNELPLPKTKTI